MSPRRKPDPTLMLEAKELRAPNEFDLKLLEDEGRQFGAARLRGARVVADVRPMFEPAPEPLTVPLFGDAHAARRPVRRDLMIAAAMLYGAALAALALVITLLAVSA
jgi:hypothetical protein